MNVHEVVCYTEKQARLFEQVAIGEGFVVLNYLFIKVDKALAFAVSSLAPFEASTLQAEVGKTRTFHPNDEVENISLEIFIYWE